MQAIGPILEYIKHGLVRDRDSFQLHLQTILERVSQQPPARSLHQNGTHPTTIITTNAELEVGVHCQCSAGMGCIVT